MTTRVRIGVVVLGAVLLIGIGAGYAYRPGDDSKRGKGDDLPKITGRLTREKAAAEEAAIRKVINGFTAAYNKGDADAAMSAWTEDAEFICGNGKTYSGKEQVRILVKRSLAANKGVKQSVKVLSLRYLNGDAALEEGLITLTQPDGSSDTGKYETLWTKVDGRWLITRVRDLPDVVEDETAAATSKLRQLSWMVGEWADKEGKGDVTMTCRWGPGQTWLIQEYTVKQADGGEKVITQRIGWDAAAGALRSWVFHSNGGYSGGEWAREGNTWAVTSEGTSGDGRETVSQERWKFISDKEFSWSARDREIDEVPLPDMEVVFVKKPRR